MSTRTEVVSPSETDRKSVFIPLSVSIFNCVLSVFLKS